MSIPTIPPAWTADIYVGPTSGNPTDQHPSAGRVVRTAQGSEFIWMKGVSSLAVGDAVVYRPLDFSVVRLVVDKVGPVAVAMAANTVTTNYSWYQIRGLASVNFLDDAGLDEPMYASGTAGAIDEETSAGDLIFNCAPTATVSGGPKLATAYIDHPWTYNSGYLT